MAAPAPTAPRRTSMKDTVNKQMRVSSVGGALGQRRKGATTTLRFTCADGSARVDEYEVAWTQGHKFADLREMVGGTFGLEKYKLTDAETQYDCTSDAQLSSLLDAWHERDDARKHDVLAAWVVDIGAQLTSGASSGAGMHALWEIACRHENHAEVSDALIDRVLRVTKMACADLASAGKAASMSNLLDAVELARPEDEDEKEERRQRVVHASGICSLATVALWTLAQVEVTRGRLRLAERATGLLVEVATRLSSPKLQSSLKQPELPLHAVGALGCLLREPASQRLCFDARGEDVLVKLLSSDSAQARVPSRRPVSPRVTAPRRLSRPSRRRRRCAAPRAPLSLPCASRTTPLPCASPAAAARSRSPSSRSLRPNQYLSAPLRTSRSAAACRQAPTRIGAHQNNEDEPYHLIAV